MGPNTTETDPATPPPCWRFWSCYSCASAAKMSSCLTQRPSCARAAAKSPTQPRLPCFQPGSSPPAPPFPWSCFWTPRGPRRRSSCFRRCQLLTSYAVDDSWLVAARSWPGWIHSCRSQSPDDEPEAQVVWRPRRNKLLLFCNVAGPDPYYFAGSGSEPCWVLLPPSPLNMNCNILAMTRRCCCRLPIRFRTATLRLGKVCCRLQQT